MHNIHIPYKTAGTCIIIMSTVHRSSCACFVGKHFIVILLLVQHTFNKQFTQRFRNNRRRSTKAKSLKVVLPQTNVNTNEESVSLQEEEDKENTDALQQLIKGKNPPAQMVQSLLTATRATREKWLQTPSISIQDILQKYSALQNSKWVCNTLSINTHTCTE